MAEQTVAYWKELADSYKQNLLSAQEELREFQESSRELELELERQLELAEKKVNELNSANYALKSERDTYKTRLETIQAESRQRQLDLESELDAVTNDRDSLRNYIRELEQSNDDLERTNRNVTALLDDLEKRLNDVMEKNALLECEISEKEELHENIQRLKDETRDLRSEIAVRERVQTQHRLSQSQTLPRDRDRERRATTSTSVDSTMEVDASESTPNGVPPTAAPVAVPRHIRSSRHKDTQLSRSVTTDLSTPTAPIAASVRGTPVSTQGMSPASRLSAMSIVGDLLRRVGAIETKLKACRKLPATPEGQGDNGCMEPQPKQPHLSHDVDRKK